MFRIFSSTYQHGDFKSTGNTLKSAYSLKGVVLLTVPIDGLSILLLNPGSLMLDPLLEVSQTRSITGCYLGMAAHIRNSYVSLKLGPSLVHFWATQLGIPFVFQNTSHTLATGNMPSGNQ